MYNTFYKYDTLSILHLIIEYIYIIHFNITCPHFQWFGAGISMLHCNLVGACKHPSQKQIEQLGSRLKGWTKCETTNPAATGPQTSNDCTSHSLESLSVYLCSCIGCGVKDRFTWTVAFLTWVAIPKAWSLVGFITIALDCDPWSCGYHRLVTKDTKQFQS